MFLKYYHLKKKKKKKNHLIFMVDHGLTVNENLGPGHYYLLNMIY